MAFNMKYDTLNMAARKGQPALMELPRVELKDNAKRLDRVKIVNEHRETVQEQGIIYKYAKEHPELCPPIGAKLLCNDSYGIKFKLVVEGMIEGLPATRFELFPMAEQPEHLRDMNLITIHEPLARWPHWLMWSDTYAWQNYQILVGRSPTPWKETR